MNADHIVDKYENATVVFDGYDEGPSTKDMAQLRRSKGKVGTHGLISSENIVVDKKDNFLANHLERRLKADSPSALWALQ